MASQQEVAEIFQKMVQRMEPQKIEGMNAVIQFDLSGDNGGQYWLKLAEGAATTGTGLVDGAKMTLKASADDFYTMMNGGLNPMQAFMTGKVKIQGDTSLALKLMPLING